MKKADVEKDLSLSMKSSLSYPPYSGFHSVISVVARSYIEKRIQSYTIFVKMASGLSKCVSISGAGTVRQLKFWVESVEGIPEDLFSFSSGGKLLKEDLTWGEIGIVTEDTVEVRLRLLGGSDKPSPAKKNRGAAGSRATQLGGAESTKGAPAAVEKLGIKRPREVRRENLRRKYQIVLPLMAS